MHGLGSMTFGFVVQDFLNINVPLVFLERSR